MPDASVTLELMLHGAAIGALTASAIGIWRVASGRPMGLAALLPCIAAISHVIESSGALRTQLGPALASVRSDRSTARSRKRRA